MSRLFVFEGPDDVGKSTLVAATERALLGRGIECVSLSLPGSEAGTLGRHIYELHHRPAQFDVTSLSPTGLQLLHVAAHVDTIQQRIAPAIRAEKVVLVDRYWWSTWAYGRVSGVPRRELQIMIALERHIWRSLQPHAVFLLERTEAEAPPPLLDAYGELARREASRCRIVRLDNNGPPQVAATGAVEVIFETLRTGTPCGTRLAARPNDSQADSTDGTKSLQNTPRGPIVFASLRPAVPTQVYDTYWRFAAERQAIFFRQVKMKPGPLTKDPILLKYKFTNVYRASDRVSQFLIRKVIYAGDQTPKEVFFRTVLFKLFNRIDTWRLLEQNLGTVRYSDFDVERYGRILTEALASGTPIYSAAYIMPMARGYGTSRRKHMTHLRLLRDMMWKEAPERLRQSRSLREAFEILRSFPMLGNFLAYQLVTDLNYSQLIDFSEMDFVVPGPGALDGLQKCFRDTGGLSEADLIHLVAERQEAEFSRLGIDFQSLWGRRLQLIDCQNLFCEVDKYARLAHPEVEGLSGRKRIKQRYRPAGSPIPYWYPPKWGINSAVARDLWTGGR